MATRRFHKIAALIACACLLIAGNAKGAETVARQVETLENRAQDLEHLRKYSEALGATDEALVAVKSLYPYAEKVTELRARHLRYLLITGPFSQFVHEMSALNKDAPLIERAMHGADAVIELDNLHEALIEYAIKNSSEDAYKLDLESTRNFKKCGFNSGEVIIKFAQYYIKKGNYKILASLGKQFIEVTKGAPSLFGQYLIFLSMDKAGKKKEAAAYLAKLMTLSSGSEYAKLKVDMHLADAMRDALQFDDASSRIAKVIQTLKGLEQRCATTTTAKQQTERISYLVLEANCCALNCRLAAQKKNYQLMFDNAKRGETCMDETFKLDPRLERSKTSRDGCKDVQAFEEEALRGQGKTAQADQLRADRFKRRFGAVFE